ncbi:LacI family DNA-binding transcriptional regulator [Fusibacter sp. 3D3]|uniref:LacI family DNA-binding transcriptional regulator n=1 Tax=Fusibacter sp. 3D3 TaxID=1048380 RepID=UPI000852FEEB|nr:LacI family DNA-binding transcriptional regulator [Fusibacter sp. 3D3]GAU79158.1 transcriptional regulator, LacI family [Fusibacter sp. 3D3]
MVTIYDIAKACGCSSGTVSKAFNNYADINSKTKERILKTASEMGFIPNTQARALSTKKTWTIGVLFQDESHGGLTHYFFAQILEAVKEQAEESGYDLTFISKIWGKQKRTYLEHCRMKKTDGVIIACINFDSEEVQELMKSEIPVVVIDYTSPDVCSIVSENYRGLNMLTNFLIQLGHKDIVYMNGHLTAVTYERINGYKNAIQQANLRERIIDSKYYDRETTIEVTKILIDSGDLPTAIIYQDDYGALWGIKTLREAHIRVPEDISVAGFDGIELGEMIHPRLTTIKQDMEGLGRGAALKCIKMIESKIITKTKTTVGLELVVGGTCQKIESR